jgi:hypothetical protein
MNILTTVKKATIQRFYFLIKTRQTKRSSIDPQTKLLSGNGRGYVKPVLLFLKIQVLINELKPSQF